MTKIVFLDTETTGLDHRIHEVWEVAAILRGDSDREFQFQLPLVAPRTADPMALQINNYYDRSEFAYKRVDSFTAQEDFVVGLHRMITGAVIVGSKPGFDMEFLEDLFRRFNLTPMWHHHPIDIQSFVAGYLLGTPTPDGMEPSRVMQEALALPFSTSKLSEAIGVPVPTDRHAAMADARWVRDMYDKIHEGR